MRGQNCCIGQIDSPGLLLQQSSRSSNPLLTVGGHESNFLIAGSLYIN